jgi:hypothetical protein
MEYNLLPGNSTRGRSVGFRSAGVPPALLTFRSPIAHRVPGRPASNPASIAPRIDFAGLDAARPTLPPPPRLNWKSFSQFGAKDVNSYSDEGRIQYGFSSLIAKE